MPATARQACMHGTLRAGIRGTRFVPRVPGFSDSVELPAGVVPQAHPRRVIQARLGQRPGLP